MPLKKEKIVIVSNRASYNIIKSDGEIKYKKSVGGLVTALDSILYKNDGLWIVWDGNIGYDKDFKKKIRIGNEDHGYSLKFISLSAKELRDYYNGFSNRFLWPLFHGFISQSYFNLNYWKSYQSVNNKFADSIMEEISGKELVWVQDYHLTLVPGKLRKINPDLKLLFFPISLFLIMRSSEYYPGIKKY